MTKNFALLTFLMCINTFANAPQSLLEVRMERPFLHCELGNDSVKITRRLEGITFSKIVDYKISSLDGLIAAAYENRLPMTKNSEYTANFRDSESGPLKFDLDLNEPNALKLIRLMSTLCEVRRF